MANFPELPKRMLCSRTARINTPVNRGEPDPNTLELPAYHTTGSAGFDLRSVEAVCIPRGERAVLRTGVAIALPAGTVGLICPRSGLAIKHGVTVLNAPGVIDSDYRGELHVPLINHGSRCFIAVGDRIAQLVIVPVIQVELVEVDGEEALGKTARGAKGLGSTGR